MHASSIVCGCVEIWICKRISAPFFRANDSHNGSLSPIHYYTYLNVNPIFKTVVTVGRIIKLKNGLNMCIFFEDIL
jgi:hypothetical protein